MKAKRLPSGSYRALAYSHTDPAGKRHYESFTAPTKAEAEMRASEFSASKRRRARSDLTVGEAIDGYIKAKEGVLSPSTVRSYYGMAKHFSAIEKKRLRSLSTEDVQRFVSGLFLSPKSVSNIYGLFSSACRMYAPDMRFDITLPSKRKKRFPTPSEEQVRMLYEGADPKLRLCIALAMCGFRRGEICALRYEDIDGKTVHVHADMVKDKDSRWVYKETPKELESDRFFILPDFVADLIGDGEGFIVKWSPDSITKRFIDLRRSLGLSVRFHDLRHFFASIGAEIMPDYYLEDMGGWARGSRVMKSVYQDALPGNDYARKMADRITSVVFPENAARNAARKTKKPLN